MNTTKRLVQKVPVARVSRRLASRRRRRGQALLLAVLLMVFAALLGSTFITVVALNLSQTSRGESKQDAQNSALAGLRDANTQLQVSEQGEHWRPEQVNTPAFCGDGNLPANVDCDTYYTPFEKAQGWARDVPYASNADAVPGTLVRGDWDKNGIFENQKNQKDDWAKLEYYKKSGGKRVFVKFPDPRQLSGTSASRPTYLVEVKPITKGEKKDELQIDVIGRSSNSETAFYRTTTNKGTSTSGAPVAFARYDANYDPETGRALETELMSDLAGDPATPVITVKDARGINPGMTLLLQKGTTFRSAVVKEVQPQSGSTSGQIFLRTLTQAEIAAAGGTYGTGYTVGSKVRVVSTLMDGLPSLDDDGDGDSAGATAPTTSVELPLRSASDPATNNRKPIGAHINNGLIVKGNAVMGLSPVAPDADSPDRKDYLNVQGRVITSPGAALRDASAAAGTTPAIMPSSSGDANGANKIGGTGLSSLQLLVRDSVQGDAGDPTQRGNSVRSLAPPNLDKSSERYLKLTKLADVENGSTFGYGPGIFINNREDIEKIGVAVPTTTPTDPAYRPLSVSDLQRFWQRKSFVAKEEQASVVATTPGTVAYKDDLVPNVAPTALVGGQADATHYRHRLAYGGGIAYPVASGSLEQQGVRGWISATEFLPRGVLIELNDNKIVITRDDLSDASSSIPDDGKAWKDTQGETKATSATSPISPRTYRMVIDLTTDLTTRVTGGQRSFGAPGFEVPMIGTPTPFNGLIYAEGNVRVRGNVGNRNKDITIVSMGNIYVEGSIKRANATSDHVALLAKKNVILNPTQFLPRLSGLKSNAQQTIANTAKVYPGATTTDVPVSQPQAFRVGDRVRVGTNPTWTTVTAISATTTDVSIPATPTAVATLTLSPALTPAPVATEAIQTLGDPKVDLSGREYEFGTAGSDGAMFTRNVPLEATVEPHYLWLLHAGGRTFFDLKKNDNNGGPNTREVLLKADNGGHSSSAPTSDGKIVSNLTDPELNEKFMYLDPPGGSNNFNIDLTKEDRYPTIGSPMFKTEIEQPNGSGSDKHWDISNLPANMAAAQPWRLANLYRAFLTAGDIHPVPLTTSATNNWASGLDTLNLNPNPALSIISKIGTVDAAYEEKIDTVSELFYQRKIAGTFDKAPVHWTEFKIRDAGGPYTGMVSYSVPSGSLATYRFAGFRLNGEPYTVAVAKGNFKSALDIQVEASIFAQDGSWFVIPMPALNLLDTNGDTTISDEELQNSLSASEIMNIVDVNPKDGSVTDTEYTAGLNAMTAFARAKAVRFRRPDYKITIMGNIAQNISPTSDYDYDDEKDPDGNNGGAVQTWINSLSCPTSVVAASGTNYKGSNWQSIEYQAAPLPTDNNLYMPVSPDLVYQG